MKPPEIKRLPIIQYHDLVIDPQCHTVALSGEEVILFPKEFNVLLLLAHYPGWVLTPTQIYTSIWHIARLAKPPTRHQGVPWRRIGGTPNFIRKDQGSPIHQSSRSR